MSLRNSCSGPDDYLTDQKVKPSNLEEHVFSPTGLRHNAKHDITIEAFNKVSNNYNQNTYLFLLKFVENKKRISVDQAIERLKLNMASEAFVD